MRIAYIFLLPLLFSNCSGNKVVNPVDYQFALQPAYQNSAVAKTNKEIKFWQARLNKDTSSFVNMLELGYQYLALFKLKGEVKDLKKGNELVEKANEKLNGTDPNILESLSQASITQHLFKKAVY